MEAKEKELLSEIISAMKSQFIIPVFQRNYSWKNKSCERLFNDIISLTENKEDKHFIGSFVYKFNKIVNTQFNQYVLIDGQQRLTSITLILKALYDYLDTYGETYSNLRNEIKTNYLYNVFSVDVSQRLKLKPNKEDDVTFSLLMDENSDDRDDRIDKSNNVYVNYEYFYNRIKNMSCSVDDFYNAMQRLEGVAVQLGDNDNPQVIFESLNSTGEDLSDVDLIRNYLLMNCEPDKQENLYSKYWIKMEKKLSDKLVNYFRDYLSMKNNFVVSNGKTKVYTAFKEYYKNGSFEIEEYLKEALDNVEVYSKLINGINDNSDIASALNSFIELDMATTYPFMLAILIDNHRGLIDDIETSKIIKLIESYVVRRSICSVQGGSLSTMMASLYNAMKAKYKEKFYDNTFNKVAVWLVSINTNAYFPKDSLFETQFIQRDMYKSQHKFHILSKLESYLQNKEVINMDNLTIEHIMPRTLTEDWKKYLNIEDVETFHEEYKNRVGNLTLTAYNSEMSCKLFDEKKIHVDFSRLCLNQPLKDVDTWNKNAIDTRGKELFDIAIKIWEYPNVQPSKESIEDACFILSDEDDNDYTGTKPSKIVFDNVEKFVNSWAELYNFVLNKMFSINNDVFINLALSEEFLDKCFGENESKFRQPSKIGDLLYVEDSTETMKKIKIIKKFAKELQLEPESIKVYLDANN